VSFSPKPTPTPLTAKEQFFKVAPGDDFVSDFKVSTTTEALKSLNGAMVHLDKSGSKVDVTLTWSDKDLPKLSTSLIFDETTKKVTADTTGLVPLVASANKTYDASALYTDIKALLALFESDEFAQNSANPDTLYSLGMLQEDKSTSVTFSVSDASYAAYLKTKKESIAKSLDHLLGASNHAIESPPEASASLKVTRMIDKSGNLVEDQIEKTLSNGLNVSGKIVYKKIDESVK
jgi:hypothetical protein